MATFRPRASLRSFITLCIVTAAGVLAVAESAAAGTYTVDACQRPDGTPIGADGWVPSSRGQYVIYGNSCGGSAGRLVAEFDAAVEHDYSDFALWLFRAPAFTSLVGFSAERTAQAGPDRPFGSPGTVLKTESQYLEQCAAFFGCSSADGTISRQLGAVSDLVLGVECGGGSGGRCPAGTTRISVKRVSVTLSEDESPSLVAQPSGTLMSATATSRNRSLTYSAIDKGAGVYRHRLQVDGAVATDEIVNDNGGKCATYSVGGHFAHKVPCPLSVSGTLSLDTATLSDGPHELKLEVVDATGTNKVSYGPWAITVDNAAPSIGEVGVSGTAREGELLRCAAPVGGQAPRVSYQWFRAGPDGSGQVEVIGAEAATFAVASADVGKKLLCRVTASDAGGTASRSSSVTSGPFANGVLVQPKPAGPGGAPGSNGANGGAGGAGAAGQTGLAGLTGGSAAAFAAAAVPPCTTASVKLLGTTAASSTRTYKRSSVSLSGRLVGVAGEPKAGRVLDLVQTVVRAGTAQRRTLASVRTGDDGAFKTTAARGPTRALQLVDATCGAVGRLIAQKVRGAVEIKTATRRVRNRQTARITGRVLGGYVGKGLPLELQVKIGRQWRDVKHTTSNARGEFRVGYRFLRTYVRYTYEFRVVSRAGSAWPYMPARSRVVKVRVN